MNQTIKINWADWKIRFDEMVKRETPDHPDVKGGPAEHVNGPKVKVVWAIGSVEWAAQQREAENGKNA